MSLEAPGEGHTVVPGNAEAPAFDPVSLLTHLPRREVAQQQNIVVAAEGVEPVPTTSIDLGHRLFELTIEVERYKRGDPRRDPLIDEINGIHALFGKGTEP